MGNLKAILVLAAALIFASKGYSQADIEQSRLRYELRNLTDLGNPKVQQNLAFLNELQGVRDRYRNNPNQFFVPQTDALGRVVTGRRQLTESEVIDRVVRRWTDVPNQPIQDSYNLAYKFGDAFLPGVGLLPEDPFIPDTRIDSTSEAQRILDSDRNIRNEIEEDSQLYIDAARQGCEFFQVCPDSDFGNSELVDALLRSDGMVPSDTREVNDGHSSIENYFQWFLDSQSSTNEFFLQFLNTEDYFPNHQPDSANLSAREAQMLVEFLDNEAAKRAAEIERLKVQREQQEVVGGMRALGYFATLAGDYDAAEKALGGADLIDQFFNIQNNTNLGAMAAFSGYLGIGIGIADLLKGGESANGMQVISEIVGTMRKEMHERFDRLEIKLQDIENLTRQNARNISAVFDQLLILEEEIRDFQLDIVDQFRSQDFLAVRTNISNCESYIELYVGGNEPFRDNAYDCFVTLQSVATNNSKGGSLTFQRGVSGDRRRKPSSEELLEELPEREFYAQQNVLAVHARDHFVSDFNITLPPAGFANFGVWSQAAGAFNSAVWNYRDQFGDLQLEQFANNIYKPAFELVNNFYDSWDLELASGAIDWFVSTEETNLSAASQFLANRMESYLNFIFLNPEQITSKTKSGVNENLNISTAKVSTAGSQSEIDDMYHGWGEEPKLGYFDTYVRKLKNDPLIAYLATEGRGKIVIEAYVNNRRAERNRREQQRRLDREGPRGGASRVIFKTLDLAFNLVFPTATAVSKNGVVVKYIDLQRSNNREFVIAEYNINDSGLSSEGSIDQMFREQIPARLNASNLQQEKKSLSEYYENKRNELIDILRHDSQYIAASFENPISRPEQEYFGLVWRLDELDLNRFRSLGQNTGRSRYMLNQHLLHVFGPAIALCEPLHNWLNEIQPAGQFSGHSIGDESQDAISIDEIRAELSNHTQNCGLDDDYVPKEIREFLGAFEALGFDKNGIRINN